MLDIPEARTINTHIFCDASIDAYCILAYEHKFHQTTTIGKTCVSSDIDAEDRHSAQPQG